MPRTDHTPASLRRAGMVGLALVAGFSTEAVRSAEPPPAPSQAPVPASPSAAVPADAVALPLPLFFANTEIGQPTVHLSGDGRPLSFVGDQILRLLEPIVVAPVLERLRSQIAQDGKLPIARFADVSLMIEYDRRQVLLRVNIPFALRTVTSVSIAARAPPREHLRRRLPASTSAYVNLRAAEDFLSRGGTGDERGRQPVVVDFDGAVGILGMTLEGTALYSESSTDTWQRGDVRLIKDFRDDRNRLTLGDLNYGTTGFQGFDDAGGISFSRNFNLQPYRINSSVAERTFNLTRASDVEVFVNGRPVRKLKLDPGRYNVRDLPLAAGTNDIALRIVDNVGRTETIQFPFVFDTNLLAPGEQEFSHALGFRSTATSDGKDYNTRDPLYSAFHAVGINDYLTIGGNFQVAQRQRVAGTEARLGTVLGVFRGDLAVSDSSYAPTDVAARLQYRYTEPATADSRSRNLLANITYRGKSFASLGTIEPSNPTAWDVSTVYGQKLATDWFGSAGLAVQFNRSGAMSSDTFDIGLHHRLTDSLFLDILGRRDRRTGEKMETSAFVTLSWVPFQSRQRVTIQRNTADRSTRMNWSYSPAETVGGVQANATVERLEEQRNDRVNGDVTYTDYRYRAQLRYDETFHASSTAAQRTTGFRLESALVFADGHFAVSRPISDSFAMIVPHPTLGDREVQVNAGAGRPQAKTDGFGPAVLPRLPAYYLHRVSMNVPDLPPGYDLGDQVVDVEPTYRSGTIVLLGTGAKALVEGTLVDGKGKPIPLQLGSIVSLADVHGAAPRGFFTDESGGFQLTGLLPGRYELRLEGAPGVFVRFDVPEAAAGNYPVGTLVLPVEEFR